MNASPPTHNAKARWPAEWEPHSATWLSWPRNADTWPRNLAQAQAEFADFVRVIAEVEPVKLLCGGDARETASRFVGNVPNVELIDLPTNDAWMRDYGPTFVEQAGQATVIDWTYNAWGGKYPPFDNDAQVALAAATRLQIPTVSIQRVIEGGALEGNGAGVVMTTRSCLLNPNRSGPRAEKEIDALLKEQLGANEIWWLEGGDMVGDDTDGHIDQIARFISADTILVSSEQNSGDPNYQTFRRAQEQLLEFSTRHQGRMQVIELPMPSAVMMFGVRLPASYANFYFANGIVIVPQFDDPNDEHAIKLLRTLLPDRKVIPLASRNLSVGLGSFHCLSQQQPKF
jgi:agmatine deiminase